MTGEQREAAQAAEAAGTARGTGVDHEPARAGPGTKVRVATKKTVPLRAGPVWGTVTVQPEADNIIKVQPKVDWAWLPKGAGS